MQKYREFRLSLVLLGLVLTLLIFIPALQASEEKISAKGDYVTCWKQPCIYDEGIGWSKKNPNGVAIAVAMGMKPVVTDDQIKEVLSRDFSKHGMTNIKFFYEQNDAPVSVITFHIRGGTEGLFLIDKVRDQVAAIAKRAKNKNPLFQ